MQNNQPDQELAFKKRARRRLVGAIALVLLMVILLPMVLKDRSVSQQDKITISLPNEATTTVTPAPVTGNASEFDSSVVPNEPASSSSAAQSTNMEATQEASTETQSRQETTSQAEPKTEEPKPTNAETSDSQVQMPQQKSSPEKKDSAHRFYVQVGVFSDAANVKKLQAKLEELGYKSFTEKIGTDKGEKIRLKTQTFSNRSDAAAALGSIKDAGLTGMVVSQ